MKKLLKFLGITIVIFTISSFSYTTNDWVSYFENEEIKIESSSFLCDKPADDIHNKYVVLKVTNKTNKAIEVSFKKELWYNDICTTCTENKEFETKISLQPNEIKQADCESKTKELKIYQGNPNSRKALSKFELKEISIKN